MIKVALKRGLNITFDSEYEPFFQPPGWVVGPVWAVLYTCMAISLVNVLAKRSELSNFALICAFFVIQLVLNLAWPGVFNSERYLTSLVMLFFMILFTALYAYMIYDAAPFESKLMWPYIAWMTFAAMINTAYYLEFR